MKQVDFRLDNANNYDWHKQWKTANAKLVWSVKCSWYFFVEFMFTSDL